MDDDVLYLGTRLVEPPVNPCEPNLGVTNMPPLLPARSSLAGITLHVDKCGDKPAHDLTFYRISSGYVNIGRKSGSDDRSMRRENDNHNVVFTCQVVSARHAKLVLSDSGQVYIIDLHSRHGTHLLRRGETTTRMLPAEVETLLADGDVLTFGKVVGAGSYHVSPVTVRVELLSHLPSEPPADRAASPFHPSTFVIPRPRRLSSGRYGLIAASCVESDSSHSSSSSISMSPDVASSPSDQDSDVEDNPVCIPSILRDSHSKSPVKIPAFRSFIRDIYHHHSPIILDVSDDLLEDAPATPPAVDTVRPPSPVIVVIEPFSSRSHSPMEVASPSPSPSCGAQPHEPAVIGAWPVSRPESPRHSSLEVEAGRSEVAPATELDREPIPAQPSSSTCQTRVPPLSNEALIELMHRLPPPPPFFPIGGPFSTSIASDFGLPSVPPPSPLPPPPLPPPHLPPLQPLHKVVSECINTEIKGTIKNVEDRMTALQDTVNDVVLRLSGSEDDVIDLQSRVDVLEPDSERLLCRVVGAERNIATLSTLQGQITALQKEVTSLREKMDAPEPRPVEHTDDFRVCANALNNLVSEMKTVREDVEKRIEAKMEVMQGARADALDALKEVVIEAESVRSFKRKRDSEVEEEVTPVVLEPVVPPLSGDVPSSPVSVPQVPIPQVPVSEPAMEPTRPKKRARTAMCAVARTAAAMAIGAAATWSALAFS